MARLFGGLPERTNPDSSSMSDCEVLGEAGGGVSEEEQVWSSEISGLGPLYWCSAEILASATDTGEEGLPISCVCFPMPLRGEIGGGRGRQLRDGK